MLSEFGNFTLTLVADYALYIGKKAWRWRCKPTQFTHERRKAPLLSLNVFFYLAQHSGKRSSLREKQAHLSGEVPLKEWAPQADHNTQQL